MKPGIFFCFVLLLASGGCTQYAESGLPNEANLARVKVGMKVERVNRILGTNIRPSAKNHEVSIKLDQPKQIKNGTTDSIPVLIEFQGGVVKAIHRGMVD